MKQFIILSIILFLNLIKAKSILKVDRYYYIFVNNTIENGINIQKRQEFLTSIIQEIDQLIIENIDTYKNTEELITFEKQNFSLTKRNEEIKSNLVLKVSFLKNVSLLQAFLSYDVKEKVENLTGVYGVEPSDLLRFKIPDSETSAFSATEKFNNNDDKIKNNEENDDTNENNDNNDNDDNDDIYINNIKLETGWKDVEIRKNADLHLSLISQGIFNGTTEQYDKNYYYPKSAGENIDVYIIDSGFDFRHSEFSNKDERITKCLRSYINSTIVEPLYDDYCVFRYDHGKLVSDVLGGLTHGVASKANLYGIGIDVDEEGSANPTSILQALDYISEYDIKPYQTVINMSFEILYSIEVLKRVNAGENLKFIDYFQMCFDEINQKGVVMVVSSGNRNENVYDEESDILSFPCAFEGVICVGAIDNYGINGVQTSSYDELSTVHSIEPLNYRRADYSNYGKQVDIYAPGTVHLEYGKDSKSYFIISNGTSYACPIVSGVIATIMSEHPEIKFDSYSMLNYLTENGHKNSILDTKDSSNIFINNGKKSIYLNSPSEDENVTEIINESILESTTENINENDFENADDSDIEEITVFNTDIVDDSDVEEITVSNSDNVINDNQ